MRPTKMRRTADAPADAEHRHRSDISWKTLGIATATEHGALSDAAIATERSRAMRGNISSDGPGHGVVGIMSVGSHLRPVGGQVPRAQCTADSPGSLASDRSQILRAQGTAGSPGSLANDRSQVPRSVLSDRSAICRRPAALSSSEFRSVGSHFRLAVGQVPRAQRTAASPGSPANDRSRGT